MFALLASGHTQAEIAKILEIDQTTISKYLKEYKKLVSEKGIIAASEEYNIEDTVEDLFELSAQLKKHDLTVAESKAGVKATQVLKKLGFNPSEYPKVINTCKWMAKEGFASAAIKLADMEDTTGVTYEQVLTQFSGIQQDLEKTDALLKTKTAELEAIKNELAVLASKKAAADDQFEIDMQQLGVNMDRLKLVEHLAKELKAAAIPDKDIKTAIEHLTALNKTGFDLNFLSAILNKAKAITFLDHGKGLLKDLTDYGGLLETRAGFNAEIKAIKTQLSGLEQQAALKSSIELEVTKLKAEKAGLEPLVADLEEKHKTSIQLKKNINDLAPVKKALEQHIEMLKTQFNKLASDIQDQESKVAHLSELKSEQESLLGEIQKLKDAVQRDQHRWQVYQWFLGLVYSVSKEELQKSSKELPALVEQMPENTSAKNIEVGAEYILETITGKQLPVLLRCQTCGAGFGVEKPNPSGKYQCPFAKPIEDNPHNVVVEKNSIAVLKQALKETPIPGTLPPGVICTNLDEHK